MSCCIKYHDIAVQDDEKYNFLILLRDQPFNLKVGVMVFCFVQNFFLGQHEN